MGWTCSVTAPGSLRADPQHKCTLKWEVFIEFFFLLGQSKHQTMHSFHRLNAFPPNDNSLAFSRPARWRNYWREVKQTTFGIRNEHLSREAHQRHLCLPGNRQMPNLHNFHLTPSELMHIANGVSFSCYRAYLSFAKHISCFANGDECADCECYFASRWCRQFCHTASSPTHIILVRHRRHHQQKFMFLQFIFFIVLIKQT